ncbi:MAG: hypothetical protein RSH52_00485 [Janthinobacterium sp.]
MKKLWQLAVLGVGLAAGEACAGVPEGMAAFQRGRCIDAVAQLRGPALGGNIKAQKVLGDIYLGEERCADVARSDAEAGRWYLLAAKGGDRVAQDELVSLYTSWSGSLRNPARALPWLRSLASQGAGEPMAQLAQMYERGEGVPADKVVSYALRLLALQDKKWKGAAELETYLPARRRAMSPDQVDEAVRLAGRWKRGASLPATSQTGRRSPQDWYRRAAEGGDMDAAYQLGMLCCNGADGLDEKEAARWLRKAAESGHAKAQLQLAMMYGLDRGVPQDYVLASMLSQLAAASGEAGASTAVAGWAKAMNAAQNAEADQLARAWKVGMPLPQLTVHGMERVIHYVREARDKLPPTPEVSALFDAASEGDEAAFGKLLAGVASPGAYRSGENTLLHVLILPAYSLVEAEQAWQKAQPRLDDELLRQMQRRAHREAQREWHAALLPAKLRMMTLLLQRGVPVAEGTGGSSVAPLHLAAMYGNAAMVRLLLAHGADVRHYGAGNETLAPLEYALQQEAAGVLPELLDADERTANMIALLDAGSGLPYLVGDQRMAELRKAQKTKDGAVRPAERPLADDMLWSRLLGLTRGTEVLDKMLATGTTPEIDDKGKSLYAYAAEAGNAGALDWLKQRVPRHDAKGNDRWLDAAMRAMYKHEPASDDVLRQLVMPGMPWTQVGPAAEGGHMRELKTLDTLRLETETLLWHAVRSQRPDWVVRLAALGAPVVSDGYRPPLLAAVENGDAAMVKLLLGLGADPLGGEFPVLRMALKLKPTPENNTVLTQLLAAVTARQPPADLKWSPLDEALRSVRDAAGVERVRLMLAAGLPASQLSNNAAMFAVASPQRALAPLLLEHGMLRRADGVRRAPGDAAVLRQALRARRADLLLPLLDLGLDPNWRGANQKSALEQAIVSGETEAVRLLIARGARIDESTEHAWGSALDLAAASLDADMLALVTRGSTLPLDKVCLPDTSNLVNIVMNASDVYWNLLLKQGFAVAPQQCEHAMAPRLITAFADEPGGILAGWLGQRFAARLPRLACGLRQLAPQDWSALRAAGRDDMLVILAAGGWRVPPAAVAPAPVHKDKAADLALQQRLPGRYALGRKTEVASQIVLRADGRFSYGMVYGVDEQAAQGRWSVLDGALLLQGDGASPDAPFALLPPRPGDATTGPARIIVEYRNEAVPDIGLAALGDAPAFAKGVSGKQPWPVPFAGPLRHLALSHPEAGLATVVLPARQGLLRFALYPPRPGMRDFHAVIGIEDGKLAWDRDGQMLLYDRVK